jgi:hypothetical protein
MWCLDGVMQHNMGLLQQAFLGSYPPTSAVTVVARVCRSLNADVVSAHTLLALLYQGKRAEACKQSVRWFSHWQSCPGPDLDPEGPGCMCCCCLHVLLLLLLQVFNHHYEDLYMFPWHKKRAKAMMRASQQGCMPANSSRWVGGGRLCGPDCKT